MWRDVLIILAFGLAVLTYLGLTPRRMSGYAKTAKGEITKRSRYQKTFLFIMIVLTLVYIFLGIWRFGTFELADFLLVMAILTAGWCITLNNVWKLSKRGEKAVNVVVYSVMLPLLVAGIILSDMLLWQKLAYPLGGACIGFGMGVLRNYRRKKREERRSSNEGDK